MGKNSFTKQERVRKRRDYLRAYREGTRIYSRNFVVILNRNETGKTRLGVTVSKKVGIAVKRNRIKRYLKEFFRLNKELLPESCDIVIMAKKEASPGNMVCVCSELLQSIGRHLG